MASDDDRDSDHIVKSTYRAQMSSVLQSESDFVSESKVPDHLVRYLKSRIIHYLSTVNDCRADILHIPGQPARLALQLGVQGQENKSKSYDIPQSARSNTIFVRNLPPDAETEDYLLHFFESQRRQGGGPVSSVTLLKDIHSAAVEFEQPDAVETVIGKQPILMFGTVVDIEVLNILLHKDEQLETIHISGLPQGLADDILAVQMDFITEKTAKSTRFSIAQFEDTDAAVVIHFFVDELRNICHWYGASVTELPITGAPEIVTITADEKYKEGILRIIESIKKKMQALYKDILMDIDITSTQISRIADFNGNNKHMLFVSRPKERMVAFIADVPASSKQEVIFAQDVIDNAERFPTLPTIGHNFHPWSPNEKIIAVAIDFGSTYSGLGFSFVHQFQSDPTDVLFHNTQQTTIGLKQPTCILLDDNQNLHSSGHEAAYNYVKLVLKEEQNKWYFFRRFTEVFDNMKAGDNIELQDINGRIVPAEKVIVAFIQSKKEQLLEMFEACRCCMYNTDIQWVLTVPLTWTDAAKQFLRESANKAGIDGWQLSILTETEAAYLCCQKLSRQRIHGRGVDEFNISVSGATFMVIDLGDEIAKLTAYESQRDGHLKLHVAESDRERLQTMMEEELFDAIFKANGIQFHSETFRNALFLDMQSDLRATITNFRKKDGGKIRLYVPDILNDDSQYVGKLYRMFNKMEMDAEILRNLFKSCCCRIVDVIKQILEDSELKYNIFLLVGQLSRSVMIQDALLDAFPDKQIIIPDAAEVASVIGAVMFGHYPVDLSSCVAKYTYGITTTQRHRSSVQSDDEVKIFCHKGDPKETAETKSHFFYIEKASQGDVFVTLFVSPKRFPNFTEDDSENVGSLALPLPESATKTYVHVGLNVGATELTVTAQELSTYTKKRAYFQYL